MQTNPRPGSALPWWGFGQRCPCLPVWGSWAGRPAAPPAGPWPALWTAHRQDAGAPWSAPPAPWPRSLPSPPNGAGSQAGLTGWKEEGGAGRQMRWEVRVGEAVWRCKEKDGGERRVQWERDEKNKRIRRAERLRTCEVSAEEWKWAWEDQVWHEGPYGVMGRTRRRRSPPC